jgi:CelD/BcsL family acetyltransferase involved in cellulose biosynthesis
VSEAVLLAPEAEAAPAPATQAAPAPATQAAPRPAGISVSVLTAPAELEAIRAEWAALNGVARAGCLFLGPEWLIPWWKHFGAGRSLQVIALREGPALVGLLLLFAERVRLGGVSVRRIAFLGDGATGCDYLDVLAAPGRESEVLDQSLRAVLTLPWDACQLDGLLRESGTALTLSQRFPPGRPAGGEGGAGRVVRDAQLRFVCPFIPLRGTYEDYLQGLGRRENLRRREKWLARQPGFSITVSRTPEDALPDLERFLALHRARWAAEGGSDGLADERHEAFHRDAAAELSRAGMLRLYTLWCARRAVASVYGVVHRQRFLYYQSGYDPLWASRSVGLVLLARTVKDAFAEGCTEFDFLRGAEGYKKQWKRAERWTVRFQLFRGTRGRVARSALLASNAVQGAVKAALPEVALSSVRTARRLLRAPRPEGETAFRALLRLASGARDGASRGDGPAAES